MNVLLTLNQQNISLSRYEAVSHLGLNEYNWFDEFVWMNNFNYDPLNYKKFQRLAYTKKINEIIFVTDIKDLKKEIQKINWNKIISGAYVIRNHGINEFSELEIADLIYKKLNNPKVNLENPNKKIEFYKIKNKIYATKLLHENHEKYEERASQNRPGASPSSLHPRLARAMINIANEKEITDPFCGTGGILIEAGLCRIKSAGYDIDKIQLAKAKENLKYYKIKNCKLHLGDATKLKTKTKAMVTDPPYGKNTKITAELGKLYYDFLKNSEKITRKLVLSFPDNIDYERIVKKTHWKIKEHFDYYIHKSMTKKIVVLEKTPKTLK